MGFFGVVCGAAPEVAPGDAPLAAGLFGTAPAACDGGTAEP